MTAEGHATADALEVRRRSKRVASLALASAVILAGVGVALLVTGITALVAGGSALIALGVLLVVVAATGYSIAAHYPAVKQLGGGNDFARLLIVVAGVVGTVLVAITADTVLVGAGLAVLVVVATFVASMLANVNRVIVRSPESVVAPRKAA